MTHKQQHHGIQRMLDDIYTEVRYTRDLIGRSNLDHRVMQVMAQVPRDRFVPQEIQSMAFNNGPLPIGHGQTISQPYIVALMTDLLCPQPEQRILEIGTGTGYQTAILSLLCRKVVSIELIASLSREAESRLFELGYRNVEVICANGYLGWSEQAPYDGILVTAAAPRIPAALIEQLKPRGRLIIPIGQPHATQELIMLQKDDQGTTHTQVILGVAFVPLVDKQP